ncbi:hypothetical protein IAG25_39425 [Caballeronia sp. EK]|uniref:hypothetical protein n=1 Tax=Caballeronia sp. EK TaxID=2767469 RepID=UPI0016562069|nr:hypothetical protein [Caballeronia sp. EK]MBC8642861.1 hypothetical protein [Caballeronia sp. EK]
MTTVTENLCAAVHLNRIECQYVIDRLEDRHKARLPEFGINTEKLLYESKHARFRSLLFSSLLLVAGCWLVIRAVEAVDTGWNIILLPYYIGSLLAPLILIAAIKFAKHLMVIRHLRKNFQEDIIRESGANETSGTGNVVISGGFSPFAGYGIDIEGWSFAVDATKASDTDKRVSTFTQAEFLNHVSASVKENIRGCVIDDKLFVNGQRIQNNKLFLSEITAVPKTSIDPSFVTDRIGDLDKDIRHYRALSIPLAEGQFCLTYFLRSTMLGNDLFIECRSFLLLPIWKYYSPLEDLPNWRGLTYHTKVFAKFLLASPISWLSGPIEVLSAVGRTYEQMKWSLFGHPEDKLKRKNASYNYGNNASLRERFASNRYNSYFQMVDKDMSAKTCQYILINSIVDFLASKGIATDEIKERRTQIFNSGVIVSGGTVTTQQLAVGTGAVAKTKIASMVTSNE